MEILPNLYRMFQFTLPCRERLEALGEHAHVDEVSIHAPV